MSSLQFKTAKILVLLDILPDVLLKHKSLKPIMDQLKAKNIRFGWSAALDIIVL